MSHFIDGSPLFLLSKGLIGVQDISNDGFSYYNVMKLNLPFSPCFFILRVRMVF